MAYLKRISIERQIQSKKHEFDAFSVQSLKRARTSFDIRSSEDVSLSDFNFLNDSKWNEYYLNGDFDISLCQSQNSSNLVDYLSARSTGNEKLQKASLSNVYGTKHLLQNGLLTEHTFNLDRLNKVFSSQWLNDRQVVFGTKCNNLVILDVITGKKHFIPTLKSSSLSNQPENPCGIHSIQINPSRTLLATGGNNTNDIAVYKLPTMDPVCVGENAHDDWIFDFAWLDDEFVVSGSRDTKLGLWRVRNDDASHALRSFPDYYVMNPLQTKKCHNAEKIRALMFNENNKELVVLSLNAYIHTFDIISFRQKYSYKLPYCMENVCLTQQVDRNLYAVGSKSHVALLDGRQVKPIEKIASRYRMCGIRSLSFVGNLLTIGTGVGAMMFYDIRNMSYLENNLNNSTAVLKTAKGWVYPDEIFQEVFFNMEYKPAIYTHQYDSSKTRIFAAGGPLPASLQGHYAGLWR